MSVNLLGDRKRHAITAAIRMPVLRAWVRSHHECGRWAFLTIGWTRYLHHHRHFWYDRWTGEFELDTSGLHTEACVKMFPSEEF